MFNYIDLFFPKTHLSPGSKVATITPVETYFLINVLSNSLDVSIFPEDIQLFYGLIYMYENIIQLL